ncbi:MAG: porin [Pseudomonadota bacterium]
MQKKIIALAVAGLMSGAAFAQSNVTIYGVVDMSYLYSSKSDSDSLKSRSGIDSGSQSGSRIGFKGEEALGGGNKVGFVLENSIGVDTGSGPSMTRQSFLYGAGSWGTVAAGRQYTPQFNLVAAVDPFGVGTIGDAFTGRGVYFAGIASGDVIRVDNLLAYISPSFGGLTVTAGYTMDAAGNEAVTAKGADSSNIKLWAINPVYSNGPLYVAFNYHNAKQDSTDFNNKVWDLGATYNFGAVKVAGLYGQNKVTDGVLDGFKVKQWLLGATVPMGSGALMASYARMKESATDAKASKFALGYQYDMSKRTNLYAVYAKISTNDVAEGGFSVRDWTADDYTSGLNVGVRHKF